MEDAAEGGGGGGGRGGRDRGRGWWRPWRTRRSRRASAAVTATQGDASLGCDAPRRARARRGARGAARCLRVTTCRPASRRVEIAARCPCRRPGRAGIFRRRRRAAEGHGPARRLRAEGGSPGGRAGAATKGGDQGQGGRRGGEGEGGGPEWNALQGLQGRRQWGVWSAGPARAAAAHAPARAASGVTRPARQPPGGVGVGRGSAPGPARGWASTEPPQARGAPRPARDPAPLPAPPPPPLSPAPRTSR